MILPASLTLRVSMEPDLPRWMRSAISTPPKPIFNDRLPNHSPWPLPNGRQRIGAEQHCCEEQISLEHPAEERNARRIAGDQSAPIAAIHRMDMAPIDDPLHKIRRQIKEDGR